LKIASKA